MLGVWELTASERRVAVLVAEGWTNRGIGERLGVSHRTVERHINGIYRKLDYDYRHSKRVKLARHIWEGAC